MKLKEKIVKELIGIFQGIMYSLSWHLHLIKSTCAVQMTGFCWPWVYCHRKCFLDESFRNNYVCLIHGDTRAMQK